MYTNITTLKAMGGKYAAQRMYQDGQGHESNIFTHDTDDHIAFAIEMSRLQQEELQELMG